MSAFLPFLILHLGTFDLQSGHVRTVHAPKEMYLDSASSMHFGIQN